MSQTRLAPSFRFALICGVFLMFAAAARTEDPKPSSYAPMKDLRAQVDFFLGRIETDLEDEDEYGEDQIGRIEKDAATLAALALVLGLHDEDNDLKKVAPGMIEAAGDLASVAEEYEEAKEAFAALTKAMKTESDEPLEWEAVTDLGLLMIQVPIINNSLRRGVTGRRFSRLADKNAGYAATLAAIAQASYVDDSYCADEEEEGLWKRFSGELRDASASVNAAIRKGDQAAATEGLAEMVKSCDDSHEVFNPTE